MTDHTPCERRYTRPFLISEKNGSAVVLSFGRMNPPTSGHQKLVDKIVSVAKQKKATPELYLSHSHDKKKNPLTYDDKIRFAKKAFGKIVQKSDARTIIEVLKNLDGKYDNVTVVVGSDRVSQFEKLVKTYNGKDYNFESIEVVSAGERDPDADDVSGMSASKLRAIAAKGDYDEFKTGLPRKMSDNDKKKIYDAIRKGMSINEAMTMQQRLKRRQLMRRIKGRIKLGRKRAKFKLATQEKLKKRSMKKAREILRKKVAGQMGQKYKELPMTARIQIDKKLEKKKAIISRIAKKLLPKVRKAEQLRLKQVRSTVKENYTDAELFEVVNEMLIEIEMENISEKVEKNLIKKSQKYDVDLNELKSKFCEAKLSHDPKRTYLNEEQWAFDSINNMLAVNQKCEIQEAIQYHIDNDIPFVDNIFRMHSLNYYELFNEARKLYQEGDLVVNHKFDIEVIESDIGTFGVYEGEHVPLDCPMAELDEEEDKDDDVELNKPKRGGPKKFYVFVKDPQTGNVKKVTFGDTTGLSVKFDDDEARKSFVARHKCSQKNDKTKPGYWACRLPKYAKQLGLSGGGNFFW